MGRHAPYSCSFALTTFTRLCRLTLFEDSADVLLPSLAGLTALTRLSLVDVADAASISKLKWVPPQVRKRRRKGGGGGKGLVVSKLVRSQQ